MLKWVLKGMEGMGLILLVQDRDKGWALTHLTHII